MSKRKTYTHYVNLPKGSVSPTSSIYGRFDIEKQESVLWSSNVSSRIESNGPFLLKVRVGNKVRNLQSKVNK